MKILSTLKTTAIVASLSLSLVQASGHQVFQPGYSVPEVGVDVRSTRQGASNFVQAHATINGQSVGGAQFGSTTQNGVAQVAAQVFDGQGRPVFNAASQMSVDSRTGEVNARVRFGGDLGNLVGGVFSALASSSVGPQGTRRVLPSQPPLAQTGLLQIASRPTSQVIQYYKDGELKTITQEQIDDYNKQSHIKISIEGGVLVIRKLIARDTWITEHYPLHIGSEISEPGHLSAAALVPEAPRVQAMQEDLKPCLEGIEYVYLTGDQKYHVSTSLERACASKCGVEFAVSKDDRFFYIFDTTNGDPGYRGPFQRKLRARYEMLPGNITDLSEYTEVGMNGESLDR